MSSTDSTIFTLDEVATVIWEAVDGSAPIDEIVRNNVCAHYDISPEVVLRDTEGFVWELARHGLLLLSDKPLVDPASSPVVIS